MDVMANHDSPKADHALMAESLQREIERSLSTLTDKEREIIRLFFGIGMNHGLTLEEIGAKFNLTRERVRQLQKRVTDRLNAISFPLYMPALDSALALLRDEAPLTIPQAAELLKHKKIASVNFHPWSLLRAANACGRTPPIQTQTIRGKSLIVTSHIIQILSHRGNS